MLLRPDQLLIALALVGCASHPVAPDDAATTTGVPCGAVECAPCADQFCDTADYGVTGTCRAHVTANYEQYGCDGSEDCGFVGALGACCLIDGIGSACSTAGCGTSGRFMCHRDADCASGERCCKLAGAGSPSTYAACKAGGC